MHNSRVDWSPASRAYYASGARDVLQAASVALVTATAAAFERLRNSVRQRLGPDAPAPVGGPPAADAVPDGEDDGEAVPDDFNPDLNYAADTGEEGGAGAAAAAAVPPADLAAEPPGAAGGAAAAEGEVAVGAGALAPPDAAQAAAGDAAPALLAMLDLLAVQDEGAGIDV